MLHDSPLFVTVHPDDCAAWARSTISPREGRVAAVFVPDGVSPATIAEFSAVNTSWEIACACACERLWLEPPQVTQRSESDVRAAIAHMTRKLVLRIIDGLPRSLYRLHPWLRTLQCRRSQRRCTVEIAASVARTLQRASVCSFSSPSLAIKICTACATLTRAVLDNGCDAVLNRDSRNKSSRNDFHTAKNFVLVSTTGPALSFAKFFAATVKTGAFRSKINGSSS
jgi:hypothetical protein